MDSFNKVLSFVLGLVVVVVFIIVLSNRLDIGNKLLPFRQTSPTAKPTTVAQKTSPTPTVGFFQPTTQPQPKGGQQAQPQPTKQPTQAQKGVTPTTIPSTGSPTEALLVLNSALLLGFFLRKKTS